MPAASTAAAEGRRHRLIEPLARTTGERVADLRTRFEIEGHTYEIDRRRSGLSEITGTLNLTEATRSVEVGVVEQWADVTR